MEHLSEDVIDRYVLDKASRAERQIVEQHLAACLDCEVRIAETLELRGALRWLKALEN